MDNIFEYRWWLICGYFLIGFFVMVGSTVHNHYRDDEYKFGENLIYGLFWAVLLLFGGVFLLQEAEKKLQKLHPSKKAKALKANKPKPSQQKGELSVAPSDKGGLTLP